MKENSMIHFKQAALSYNEKDKFSVYGQRIQSIATCLSKSPFLQLMAWPLWERVLDISTPYAEKDYSNYLAEKSEEVFRDFEELQGNQELIEFQKSIKEVISELNKQ